MHNSEKIPTDPVEFNALVKQKAYDLAREQSGGTPPSETETYAAEPAARLHLMAERNQSGFDRVAALMSRKVADAEALSEQVKSDAKRLLGLAKELEQLRIARDERVKDLKRADQTFQILLESESEYRKAIPSYYRGEASFAPNIDMQIAGIQNAYTRLSAIDRAKGDWERVRKDIQDELDALDQKIGTFEKQHAELFGG